MFADYRVPQILRHLKLLNYSKELERKIINKTQIAPGSEEEIEIRASTVIAVEMLKASLQKSGKVFMSLEIDWFLWQEGEKIKDDIEPHHRTLTIYY